MRSDLAMTPSNWVTVILMLLASSLGVLYGDNSIYNDNSFVKAAWWGNDCVTLFLAVPILAAATISDSSNGHNTHHQFLLIKLGLQAYALYNYCFYVFGASFNSLFLVYVGILISSTWGLVTGLTCPQIYEMPFQPKNALFVVGLAILIISSGLGIFWIKLSTDYVLDGTVPSMVTITDHPTNVTGALDLWLVVSTGALAGIQLIRGEKWGYILGTIWSIKGSVYIMALSCASLSAYYQGAIDSPMELMLWIPVGLVCTVSAVTLLKHNNNSFNNRDLKQI